MSMYKINKKYNGCYCPVSGQGPSTHFFCRSPSSLTGQLAGQRRADNLCYMYMMCVCIIKYKVMRIINIIIPGKTKEWGFVLN